MTGFTNRMHVFTESETSFIMNLNLNLDSSHWILPNDQHVHNAQTAVKITDNLYRILVQSMQDWRRGREDNTVHAEWWNGRTWIKQIRMIAYLAQLHQDVNHAHEVTGRQRLFRSGKCQSIGQSVNQCKISLRFHVISQIAFKENKNNFVTQVHSASLQIHYL